MQRGWINQYVVLSHSVIASLHLPFAVIQLLFCFVFHKLLPSGKLHVLCIMAFKCTPEANAVPHLVVKIVGSRQVRYFAEEPNK